MATHNIQVKSRTRDVATGDVATVYFTDEEWAAKEQERLDAEAVNAARDEKEEELDQLVRGIMGFIKLYAEETGRKPRQVKDLIKMRM